MSLIEKIDAEIADARYGKQYDLNAVEYRVGIVNGLEIAKGHILSEQKEPCSLCQAWKIDGRFNYCPVCGSPLNPATTPPHQI